MSESKILVFGGTTEGKDVISMLDALKVDFVYSTKTDIPVDVGEYGAYRYGAFRVNSLKTFIEENKIETIIHAAHPFAEMLHKTICNAAKKTGVTVLRLERKYPERTVDKSVFYIKDYPSLLLMLTQYFNGKTLLALTGVQSIPILKEFWKETKSYFRILDRKSSISIASKSKFPAKHLILEEPKDLIGDEEALIKKINAQVIITKESGETGALSEKIEIALKNKVPILILEKPKLPASFHIVENIERLKEIIVNDEPLVNNENRIIRNESISIIKKTILKNK